MKNILFLSALLLLASCKAMQDPGTPACYSTLDKVTDANDSSLRLQSNGIFSYPYGCKHFNICIGEWKYLSRDSILLKDMYGRRAILIINPCLHHIPLKNVPINDGTALEIYQNKLILLEETDQEKFLKTIGY